MYFTHKGEYDHAKPRTGNKGRMRFSFGLIRACIVNIHVIVSRNQASAIFFVFCRRSATYNKYFHDNVYNVTTSKILVSLIRSDLAGCHENHTRCWRRTRFSAFSLWIDFEFAFC